MIFVSSENVVSTFLKKSTRLSKLFKGMVITANLIFLSTTSSLLIILFKSFLSRLLTALLIWLFSEILLLIICKKILQFFLKNFYFIINYLYLYFGNTKKLIFYFVISNWIDVIS